MGTFAGELVLGLPICNIEAGCFWPFNVDLRGWHLTRDDDFRFTVPAVGGGPCVVEVLDPDAGNFCFSRPPDTCDFA